MTYLLGDAIVFQLCATLNFLPAVVLTAKLCPKNVESTVYALLAGFQNFGTQLSRTIGVAALGWFQIRAELDEDNFPGETCDFKNLSWLLFAAHFVCPLLAVPLTFILIPDANMKDDLEPESYAKPSDEPKNKTDGGSTYTEIKTEAKDASLLPPGRESLLSPGCSTDSLFPPGRHLTGAGQVDASVEAPAADGFRASLAGMDGDDASRVRRRSINDDEQRQLKPNPLTSAPRVASGAGMMRQ